MDAHEERRVQAMEMNYLLSTCAIRATEIKQNGDNEI